MTELWQLIATEAVERQRHGARADAIIWVMRVRPPLFQRVARLLGDHDLVISATLRV
jgi:hypothetical protein